MRSNDIEVMDAALRWAAQGQRSVLVTVLSTFGSSPRPPGAMACIHESGLIVGSVSGGCVEDDLVAEMLADRGSPTAQPVEVRSFGQGAEERARYRLPCHSTLRVAIETAWNVETLQKAYAHAAGGHAITRRVDFVSGCSTLRPTALPGFFSEDELGFQVTLGPRYRAMLIGATELAQCLAEVLTMLGYQVDVCDPRSEYANAWSVPGVRVHRTMPDDWMLDDPPDMRTAVLAVAHDPKLDDLALLEALKSPAFYVGAIGSRGTAAKRRLRLLQFDLTAGHVSRLQGPVGLAIGARTPAEIAVSVAAALVAQLRHADRNRVASATDGLRESAELALTR